MNIVSTEAIDTSKHELRVINTTPGLQGEAVKVRTNRVNLGMEADPTPQFMHFLDMEADRQAIQGVESVLVYEGRRGPIKVVLVINEAVDALTTAILWVQGVNKVIKALDEHQYAEMTKPDRVLTNMAWPATGPGIFGFKGTDDPSNRGEYGEDNGDHLVLHGDHHLVMNGSDWSDD